MFKTALVILTQPLQHIRQCLPLYMTELNKCVTKTAYIHIQPNSTPEQVENNDTISSDSGRQDSHFEILRVPFTTEIRDLVKEVYVSNAKICSNLDIRVLVGHIENSELKFKRYNFKDHCDIVFIDKKIQEVDKSGFIKTVSSLFSISSTGICQSLSGSGNRQAADNKGETKRQKLDDSALKNTSTQKVLQQYPYTVLGGTFDRLHVGHKILLSEACMLGTDKLVVGVTDGDMNKKKTLFELIQPTEDRISIVKDFLKDVQPSLEHTVEPITDAFGPTVTDPDMDLIVLSQETKKGGDMINVERKKRGMKELEEYTIELIEDSCHSQYEESKISSSSHRKRLLGTLYHPLKEKDGLPGTPYIIGLTGGIASGKSSVCKRLEGQGAKIIDCDKLGHRAYVKGSEGFEKIVEAFGQQVVGEDGEINRKELGRIVFGDKKELERLNGIVWPEIAKLAQEQIQQYAGDGQSVVVLDAAVLLEAGWDVMCHEVWTTIVPPDEAVKRMIERNKLSEDQAKQRLNSQISNSERVEKSNVILCTLWEYEYTQKQVEYAWQLLQERIAMASTSSATPKSNM